MKNYTRIIFVAQSGNSREVMAQAILKAIFTERGIGDYPELLARGLLVQFPEPMNQKAQAVLTAKLADVTGFSGNGMMSEQIKREEITEDTLVLTMETGHFKRLHDMFPDVDPTQIEVLSELVGDELEIVDPYGGQLANYGLCYENLKRSLEKLANMMYPQSKEEGNGRP